MIPKCNFAVQEITEITELARLAPEWNDLFARCPGAATFQRPEWLISWMEVFNPGELWTIAVRQSGRLLGIAPLYIQRKGSERTLAPMGAAISDYLDWQLDPAVSPAVLACLLQHIQSRSSAWTNLDLTDIPSHSPLLSVKFTAEWEIESKFHDACPVLRLPTALDELQRKIPRARRRSLRTARKKSQQLGQIRVEVAQAENLEELLASELHPCCSKKECSAFRPCGCGTGFLPLFALFEKEVAYCYLQGFDPEFAPFSPGAQILDAVIEDAVRHQKRCIDFLRGREAYKYSWGAQDTATYRLRARPSMPLLDVPAQPIAA